jgi:hypothetical protein
MVSIEASLYADHASIEAREWRNVADVMGI